MTDHNPIIQIQKLGIPTDSYIAAAVAAGDFRNSSDLVKYNSMITAITNAPSSIPELPLAQMYFGYLIQEHVRNFSGTNQLNKEEVERLAISRAEKFVLEQPWHWAEDAAEAANDKVSNREEAMRIMRMFPDGTERSSIIAAIVNQLEVSEATAMGYLRTALKDEAVEITVNKTPKINKKAAALELVRANPHLDKKTLVGMISKQFDTSPAGAQTYYYAAIKELKITPTAAPKRVNTKALVATILDENPNISRLDFLEQAEVRFGVQVTTAQTYYYALIAERKKNAETKEAAV